MRLKIEFTKPALIEADNQHIVNRFIHNLLGRDNIYHDVSSNYNVSNLCGGRLDKKTRLISFKTSNPFIIVSSLDNEFLNKILMGLLQKPFLTADCSFKDVTFINEELNDGWNNFLTLSPILLKNVDDKFLTVKDVDFSEKLREQTIRKLSAINPNLDLSDFDLVIEDKPLNRVCVRKVKSVYNYASICNVKIKGSKKIIEQLYNLGIGNSTGCGFGTIYKTFDNYKF